MPKDDPEQWVALDMTVEGADIGWEYPQIANHADFQMW